MRASSRGRRPLLLQILDRAAQRETAAEEEDAPGDREDAQPNADRECRRARSRDEDAARDQQSSPLRTASQREVFSRSPKAEITSSTPRVINQIPRIQARAAALENGRKIASSPATTPIAPTKISQPRAERPASLNASIRAITPSTRA